MINSSVADPHWFHSIRIQIQHFSQMRIRMRIQILVWMT
jgi:hypothetical protein